VNPSNPAKKFFYRRPTPVSYEFLPAEVIDANPQGMMVRLIGLDLENGDEVDLFSQGHDDFIRQRWLVTPHHATAHSSNLWLVPIGESESGSMRASPRVRTALDGIFLRFGSEDDCMVIDISEDGIAIVAGAKMEIDSLVPVMLKFNDLHFTGHVVVCSVTSQPRGRMRYGLMVQPDVDDCDLRRMLPKLTTALQVKKLDMMTWDRIEGAPTPQTQAPKLGIAGLTPGLAPRRPAGGS
jgi:hypothetical protein